VQQNDTPCTHVRMLSLGGGMEVSEVSIIMLHTDCNVRVTECQHQQSIYGEEKGSVCMYSGYLE
jgi:hypothetical protein